MKRRYTRFLLVESPGNTPSTSVHVEGNLFKEHNNLSDDEMQENLRVVHIMSGAVSAVAELFDLRDTLEFQIGKSLYLALVTSDNGDIVTTICSPKLCRNKLRKATNVEIADAVVDLVLDREQWDRKTWGQYMCAPIPANS